MHKYKKWASLLIFGLIACSNLIPKEEGYSNQLNEISKNGFVSASVIDMTTGEAIVAFNEQKRLVPASLTKIFTSAAGFELIGNDYRFSTKFFLYKAKSANKQSLIIQGGGDPTLGSDRWDETKEGYLFEKVFNALEKNNLRVVEDIILDDHLFSGITYPSKRNWEDIANYYGAAPNALTFKENTFRLKLSSPKNIGKTCKVVSTDPPIDKYFQCFVKSSTVNKDSAYIYGHPQMDTWYVSGSIPAGRSAFTIKGALPDPPKTLATRLQKYLSGHGISMQGEVKKGVIDHYKGKVLLFEHQSPTLAQIISVVNKKSFNLYADHLFFQIAISSGKEANWDNASIVLQSFWNKRIPDFSGTFYDGSGLSPFNRFSAKDMTEALCYVEKTRYSGNFKNTLSVAGQDGTLKSLFNSEEGIEGAFIGKSGSMNGVLNYCGYLTSCSGKKYAICIMVNGFNESFSEVRQHVAEFLNHVMQNE
nr:D-alanyl-D-alanine carboxypeptidase/D-alanyl-D-alanine-endopeptidase [uncultured Carboxylicivirga sp.]